MLQQPSKLFITKTCLKKRSIHLGTQPVSFFFSERRSSRKGKKISKVLILAGKHKPNPFLWQSFVEWIMSFFLWRLAVVWLCYDHDIFKYISCLHAIRSHHYLSCTGPFQRNGKGHWQKLPIEQPGVRNGLKPENKLWKSVETCLHHFASMCFFDVFCDLFCCTYRRYRLTHHLVTWFCWLDL